MPFGGWACSYQTNIPNYSKMAIKVIYIDLFCGAGGTSTGVHFARHAGDPCAKVIACVNHDANAIASHAANHPDALHYTEDIRTLELGPLAAHAARMRRQYPDAFVVLWASLECTNFSRAKGGLPRDADSRTLAEHLFRYIEALNPDYIQIENVEEFMSWGDLDERSKPVSRDAGRLYRKWVDNVRGYGYDFGHRILNAADFGAYTSRRRSSGSSPAAAFRSSFRNRLTPRTRHRATCSVSSFASGGQCGKSSTLRTRASRSSTGSGRWSRHRLPASTRGW